MQKNLFPLPNVLQPSELSPDHIKGQPAHSFRYYRKYRFSWLRNWLRHPYYSGYDLLPPHFHDRYKPCLVHRNRYRLHYLAPDVPSGNWAPCLSDSDGWKVPHPNQLRHEVQSHARYICNFSNADSYLYLSSDAYSYVPLPISYHSPSLPHLLLSLPTTVNFRLPADHNTVTSFLIHKQAHNAAPICRHRVHHEVGKLVPALPYQPSNGPFPPYENLQTDFYRQTVPRLYSNAQ